MSPPGLRSALLLVGICSGIWHKDGEKNIHLDTELERDHKSVQDKSHARMFESLLSINRKVDQKKPMSFKHVVNDVLPSTGTIVVSLCGSETSAPLLSMVPYACEEAQGSLVVVDAEKGWIVTNRHVTMDKQLITPGVTVKMFANIHTSKGDQIFRVEEMDYLDDNDLALLNLTGVVHFVNGTRAPILDIHPGEHMEYGLSAISVAKSVNVGDVVLAIGDNYGFSDTVTKGIVSAIRSEEEIAQIAPEEGEGGEGAEGEGAGDGGETPEGMSLSKSRSKLRGMQTIRIKSNRQPDLSHPAVPRSGWGHLLLTPHNSKIDMQFGAEEMEQELTDALNQVSRAEKGSKSWTSSQTKTPSDSLKNVILGSNKSKDVGNGEAASDNSTTEKKNISPNLEVKKYDNGCGIPGVRKVMVIQHDAGINSGNSGGALIDTAGSLVGINTKQITTGVSGSDGVAFAITAKDVQCLVSQWEDFTWCQDQDKPEKEGRCQRFLPQVPSIEDMMMSSMFG